MRKYSKRIEKDFFSEEKQAEAWQEVLKSYEPFKIAQRAITLIVTSVYLFMWIISASMLVLSFWYPKLLELAKVLAQKNNDLLNLPFSIIVGFYFGGGAVEGVVNKLKVKK